MAGESYYYIWYMGVCVCVDIPPLLDVFANLLVYLESFYVYVLSY